MRLFSNGTELLDGTSAVFVLNTVISPARVPIKISCEFGCIKLEQLQQDEHASMPQLHKKVPTATQV